MSPCSYIKIKSIVLLNLITGKLLYMYTYSCMYMYIIYAKRYW